jgi:hypothetical protein
MQRDNKCLVDVINRGRNILIERDGNRRYTVYMDGRKVQTSLDADSIVRWLGNAMIDGSAGNYVEKED